MTTNTVRNINTGSHEPVLMFCENVKLQKGIIERDRERSVPSVEEISSDTSRRRGLKVLKCVDPSWQNYRCSWQTHTTHHYFDINYAPVKKRVDQGWIR